MANRHLAASKEYRKAADAVGEAIPLIQAKLGRTLLAMGQVPEAIAELEKSLSDHADYMLVRLYLGEAWLRHGDPVQALGHLEAAAHINPFDPQLHAHLATVYEATGDNERAVQAHAAHAKVMAHLGRSAP